MAEPPELDPPPVEVMPVVVMGSDGESSPGHPATNKAEASAEGRMLERKDIARAWHRTIRPIVAVLANEGVASLGASAFKNSKSLIFT